MCREAIRKHLIDVRPHINLFERVPWLGLPQLLQSYLLYDLELKEDNEELGLDEEDIDDTQ